VMRDHNTGHQLTDAYSITHHASRVMHYAPRTIFMLTDAS